jgi:diacylglycerol kinase (ATP)
VWRRVEPLLRSRLPNLEAALTRTAGDAEQWAAEYARVRPGGLLIVAGGDGSIHEAVNGLLSAGYGGVLGVIPAGTGNDVARNLGIPGDPAESARLDFARARPVDVGRVGFTDGTRTGQRWFLNSISVGTSARANRIALSLGGLIRGPAKYPIAGGLALLSGGPQPYEVLVGGHTRFQGPAMNVTIANGACIGGGLRISPTSSPDDGQLELVVIGTMRRMRALRALRAIRTGAHLAMPEVMVTPVAGAAVEVRGNGRLWFEADGENRVSDDRIIVNLEPGRLQVAR